ncbi:hypothetical protein [Candidatus Poriferisodalis sp.]|uniref:hypothetical protein n=1 Tax=Candidatus Poriferisodalis sp. TaxID=3101277 RepID=UPI003B011663
MRPSGTEPGDFVEYDMDLLEAQRRTRMRSALEASRIELSEELGLELHVANEGNELVLADADGIRYRATMNPQGRLVLTAVRGASLL